MEIMSARGYLILPDLGDVEVTLDLFDWPINGETLARTWSAVIDNGPVLEPDTEGFLRLDTEPAGIGHPFVVIAAGHHVTRISGRKTV
ncbi:hypothetical protein OG948_40875 (plasmid) [Embleya sp. NBC_00888]|nr:hypothetical protein OG948_40875 [Embleya sp. NBC_00888]